MKTAVLLTSITLLVVGCEKAQDLGGNEGSGGGASAGSGGAGSTGSAASGNAPGSAVSSGSGGADPSSGSTSGGPGAGGASSSASSGAGGGYVPCAGKVCGDSCTICPPNDPDCSETAVLKFCNEKGECVVGDPACGGTTCSYGGKTYKPGETFPSLDGCNECSCLPDGGVACTDKACSNVCGGLTGLQCAKGQYCNWTDMSCGAADQTGICEAIPDACDQQFDPVCGCDGVTYSNACMAAAAGISIVHTGSCDPNNQCGGIAGIPCGKGEYCHFADDHCLWADDMGVCEVLPSACDLQYDPVCGCDGVTYSNACMAAAAGVSLAHTGTCDANKACGGFAGIACDKGDYCHYTDGECGFADQMGVCEAIPVGCPKNLDPVCGCDGMTYGNACMAAFAGVSINYAGECKKP